MSLRLGKSTSERICKENEKNIVDISTHNYHKIYNKEDENFKKNYQNLYAKIVSKKKMN